MKTTLIVSAAVASVLATSALAQGLQPLERIGDVLPMQDTDGVFRICTGGTTGAYYERASLASGLISSMGGVDAQPYAAGGTVDCLYKLAAGEVQAAIVQRDGLAWLYNTQSPLLGQLGIGGNVLTEEILGFCNRSTVDESDLNDVLQSRDNNSIAIAGGPASGTNLTVNVLANFDRQIGSRPQYTYTDGLEGALQQVQDGFARCAVAVMSSDTFALEALDDQYADKVRLVEFWDNGVRGLEFPGGEFDGGQVYGWRTIPEDHPMMDDFLDWRGNSGEGTWSPDTVAFSATLVYRNDAAQGNVSTAIRQAVAAVAQVKDDLED